jgi:O-antigen/teichoic acid export membrane protein
MKVGGTRLSFASNFLWYLAGTGVYFVSQWAMVTVLAKFGSVKMVGEFSLATAVCAPVIVLTSLSLRGVLATDAIGEYPFSVYLRVRILSVIVAMTVIVSIATLAGYGFETAVIIVLVGIAKSVESISDIVYGLFQQNERMDIVAKSMLMKGPASLAALSLAVIVQHNLAWSVVALVGVWALLLLIYDIPQATCLISDVNSKPTMIKGLLNSLTQLESFELDRRLLWLALPLAVSMALGSLEVNIPRYVIERQMDLKNLGYFSAMSYLTFVNSALVGALAQAATPKLAIYSNNQNRKAFVRLLFQLLAVGLFLGLAGVLLAHFLGAWLLAFLYTPEYAFSPGTLVWLMVANLGMNIFNFLGTAITSMRIFKIQAPIHVLIVLTILFSCVPLVKFYGLEGAAMSIVFGIFLGAALFSVAAFAGVRRMVRI